MFIERDPKKRVIKAKYFLAKPNKTVIASIHEAFDWEVTYIAGGIHELSFSIPYYVEKEFVMVENPNIRNIKERMLIKRVAGTTIEWFMVDSINESGDDEEVYTVSCFSLAYEIRDRRLTTFQQESVNAKEALEKMLLGTSWKVGTVAAKFQAMYRTFDETGSNALDFVLKIDETYNSLIQFDTKTRRVNITDPEATSKYRGLSVDYSRLMENVTLERMSEGLVTRLYIEGSEGLSIASVNPTGLNYIEDFSYFMHPFQQDSTGKVIKSSDYMSDALCIAILTQQDLVEQNANNIKVLIDRRQVKIVQLITDETTLDALIAELDIIDAQLDLAKGTGDATLVSTRTKERAAKAIQVNTQRTKVIQVQNELKTIEDQLTAVYDSIKVESNFTPELVEELQLYILERDWIDDRYIDAKELYEAGLEKFKEYRTPQFTLSVGLVNFMEIVEEEYYWDKLHLNDQIKVKHPRMKLDYFSYIAEIRLTDETIDLTITNSRKVGDGLGKLGDVIRQSATASTVLQNGKKKWDSAGEKVNLVAQMMNEEYDANKKRILAGVNNLIEIGKRGIIVRSPDYPDEVIVIQSGIMALSEDNGETWNTAITPRGIIADRLMGRIIAGQELMITNSSGSFTMDDKGAVFNVSSFVVRSGNGDTNLVDRWQGTSKFLDEYTNDNVLTPFEKRMLQIKLEEMARRYDQNLIRITHHFDAAGDLKPFVITYKAAYKSLQDYLSPMLSSTSLNFNSSINGTLFKQQFNDYDAALIALEKEFDANLESRITDVQFSITDDQIRSAVFQSETWTIQMGNLSSAISTVDGRITSAKTEIDAMMSDLNVTPIEKSTLNIVWSEIKAQYTNLRALAITIQVPTALFDTAYGKLNGEAPRIETDLLANLSQTTTLTAGTKKALKDKMDGYFAETEKLNKAISEKMNDTATNAKAGVDELMSDMKITPPEKSELYRTWSQIKAEYNELSEQAVTMGVDVLIRNSYTQAYLALNGQIPKIEDEILAMMGTTYSLNEQTRTAFRDKLNLYFLRSAEISQAITNNIKKYIDEIELNGTNMVPNSSGNLNEEGEEPTYWSILSNARDLVVVGSEEGVNSIGVTATALNGGILTPLTPLLGGESYAISFEMKADKVATFSHQMRFQNAEGVVSTPIAAQTQASVPANTWHKFELIFLAPATAVSMQTTPKITAGTMPVNFEVRRLQVEKGNSVSPWAPSNEDVIRQFVLLRTKLSSVLEVISADSIVTTITTSETYINMWNDKADASAIGDLATRDELDNAVGRVGSDLALAIAGIDFTPYVTQLQLEETSKNITAKFSATGGMNLLKNSVGYADFNFWTRYGTAFVEPVRTSALDTLGFGSGFDFLQNTSSARIEQTVSVIVGVPYTLSWYLNKPETNGDFWIQIREGGVTKVSVAFGVNNTTTGFENNYLTYIPTAPDVTIRVMSHATSTVTGLMFSIGDVPLQWSLATGEVYNTNIRMDINGIRVSQFDASGRERGFTSITPVEFAGYYDANQDGQFEKVFYLREDETVSKKFRAENEITMGTIKIIKVNKAGNRGWAFVPVLE